jgi:hypothetical protein
MCGTILASGNSMKTYFSSKEFVIHRRGTVTEQTAPGMGELWCQMSSKVDTIWRTARWENKGRPSDQ